MTVSELIKLLKDVEDKNIKVVIAHHCTIDETEAQDAYDGTTRFVIHQ